MRAREGGRGGSHFARNDCPCANNLLLPRASGSEARREHNGFLELKDTGRGASGDLRNAGSSESRHQGLLPFLPLQIPDTTDLKKQKTKKGRGLVKAYTQPKHKGPYSKRWPAKSVYPTQEGWERRKDNLSMPPICPTCWPSQG